MPEDEDDGLISEEFETHDGRVTVDINVEPGTFARGIHVYFFSAMMGEVDDPGRDALPPNRLQWDQVKWQVMEWLERNMPK